MLDMLNICNEQVWYHPIARHYVEMGFTKLNPTDLRYIPTAMISAMTNIRIGLIVRNEKDSIRVNAIMRTMEPENK
jgi:hypothetical protein